MTNNAVISVNVFVDNGETHTIKETTEISVADIAFIIAVSEAIKSKVVRNGNNWPSHSDNLDDVKKLYKRELTEKEILDFNEFIPYVGGIFNVEGVSITYSLTEVIF